MVIPSSSGCWELWVGCIKQCLSSGLWIVNKWGNNSSEDRAPWDSSKDCEGKFLFWILRPWKTTVKLMIAVIWSFGQRAICEAWNKERNKFRSDLIGVMARKKCSVGTCKKVQVWGWNAMRDKKYTHFETWLTSQFFQILQGGKLF